MSHVKPLTDQTYIVFIDEAGFMLDPVVRRTWAPRGHTPILKINRPHDRISVIGAISIRREDQRFFFHYKLSPDNTNFKGPTVVEFLAELHHRLNGDMTIIWDEIPIHWGVSVEQFLSVNPSITTHAFPPYVPELNPVDLAWAYVKHSRLANFCPHSLNELRKTLTTEFIRLTKREKLLKAFLAHTGLSYP